MPGAGNEEKALQARGKLADVLFWGTGVCKRPQICQNRQH